LLQINIQRQAQLEKKEQEISEFVEQALAELATFQPCYMTLSHTTSTTSLT
jgi:hypothetical protein